MMLTFIKNFELLTIFFRMKNRRYFKKYLEKDVQLAKKLKNLNFVHFFNEIPYTKWPFFLSFSLFVAIFYFVAALKRFDWMLGFSLIGVVLVLFYFFMWFNDLYIDSAIFGKYNRKIRACIVYGFMLFILSEVCFFSGFFWAYYDRFFHPTMFTGASALPFGLQPIYKSTTPFIATLLLMSSGVIFNYCAYLLRVGNWDNPVIYYAIGLVFGFLFLVIQFVEYKYILKFNITETVFGSLFYLLTGFHGLHVIVGMIFLTTTYVFLSLKYFYTKERHISMSLAIIYWHFVDIIWIFLFFSIYVLNFSASYNSFMEGVYLDSTASNLME